MEQTAIILLGRSGCGKGTQAKLLSEYLEKNSERKVLYVQSGSELREFIKDDGLTQRLARVIYEKGELEPEFLMINMWSSRIINNYTGGEHMIIDGTPRKPYEAIALHSMFEFYGIKRIFAVYMNVSMDQAVDRLLKRGRTDDTREDIAERLEWFDTHVLPTIEYYRNNKQYNFVEVDGNLATNDVHRSIIEKLNANLA